MDINLNNQNDDNENTFEKKNKKGFLASSLATFLIILILATISVVSYLPIRNFYAPPEQNIENYLKSSSFVYNLSQLTRNLQQSINENNDGYDDRYVNVKSVKYKLISTDNNDSTENDDLENIEDIELEASKIKSKTLSNMADISDAQLQEEIKNSLFYMRASFDETGQPTVETSLGRNFNKDAFISRLTYSNEESIEAYANLDVLYIVPYDFDVHNDVFIADMKNEAAFPQYALIILVIGAISILILAITAFAVPYAIQSKMAMSRLFNKMFLELKFVAWMGFVLICAAVASIINSYNYYGYDFGNFIYDADPYFYLVGIVLTTMLYLLIYLSIVYLKYIYNEGFKKGVIDNSFFGKIFLYCVRGVRDIIKGVVAIDLREDNYGRLVGIVVLNLFAILILGSGRFFGFVLAIAYSVFIFKYLLKVLDRAKILNDASKQVAEGDFNINLDENMGILSPMAKNLNNINEGFSLAVDKEIKSQRMKAELISNVSHDLKTPLTSIITYVDLLKAEDIDPEVRKEYIHILDTKSQRLKALIEDLFEASKATSGNIDLHLDQVDVVALFRQTLGELEEKIKDSGLQFRINTPETKVICNLDGRRTYRVFENIMTNILKYAMENSRVYIDIAEDINEVSFIFKNISSYEMNFNPSEITERFTRGDESRNTEGSGLGLSIAKSFIELQGGTLEIVIDGDLFKLIVTFPKVY